MNVRNKITLVSASIRVTTYISADVRLLSFSFNTDLQHRARDLSETFHKYETGGNSITMYSSKLKP